ncbi:MAG: SDR family NAD(P)-dependent oxidoreductase [Proteobacteria bacterium]|nr:MAG: SDR family NAD(P)-dependent oxidoreductase [Pseudomonadota bacterium]
MKLSGNTILITGGGSGIGLALAEEFKRLGNEVVVAGRSKEKLADASAKGLRTMTVDMSSLDSVEKMAADAIAKFPELNIVIHNAGIMVNEKLTTRNNSKIAADTVATNLLGPIQLTNALLPHFLQQTSATIMTVTSGLAYVPLALTPTYSATKAAIHSYTQALRYQLQGTAIEVKELVPPYVRTSLMGQRQAADANAMPLEEFISEVISILRENPAVEEILVQRVQPQRRAGDEGPAKYEAFFKKQNDTLMSVRKTEWDAL